MFLRMREMLEGSIRDEVASFSGNFSRLVSMMPRRSGPEVGKSNTDEERHLIQLNQDSFHIIFNRRNYLHLKH